MKRITLYLFAYLFISCNNSDKKSDDQKTIDSLNNVIKNQEESEKKRRSDASERNSVLVKVTTDNPTFTPVSFGGFENIRFNLFNQYQYKLEQVILKVHYIKANGTEVNTETIIKTDITANSHLALIAPDYTAAGKKLVVTVETVLCKAINLCYYRNTGTVGSDDPYICN